jgi:hypothetical protein
MPEIIVKYKNNKSLQALRDFAKYFDVVLESPNTKKAVGRKKKTSLPITYAENPDIMALAGIWKGKNISLEKLRKKAWGDRL